MGEEALGEGLVENDQYDLGLGPLEQNASLIAKDWFHYK